MQRTFGQAICDCLRRRRWILGRSDNDEKSQEEPEEIKVEYRTENTQIHNHI